MRFEKMSFRCVKIRDLLFISQKLKLPLGPSIIPFSILSLDQKMNLIIIENWINYTSHYNQKLENWSTLKIQNSLSGELANHCSIFWDTNTYQDLFFNTLTFTQTSTPILFTYLFFERKINRSTTKPFLKPQSSLAIQSWEREAFSSSQSRRKFWKSKGANSNWFFSL